MSIDDPRLRLGIDARDLAGNHRTVTVTSGEQPGTVRVSLGQASDTVVLAAKDLMRAARTVQEFLTEARGATLVEHVRRFDGHYVQIQTVTGEKRDGLLQVRADHVQFQGSDAVYALAHIISIGPPPATVPRISEPVPPKEPGRKMEGFVHWREPGAPGAAQPASERGEVHGREQHPEIIPGARPSGAI